MTSAALLLHTLFFCVFFTLIDTRQMDFKGGSIPYGPCHAYKIESCIS